jgi:hypothetical protein
MEFVDELISRRRSRSFTPEEEICSELGITARTLRRWRDGEFETVHASTVDQVLVKTHLNWHDIYPEEEVA